MARAVLVFRTVLAFVAVFYAVRLHPRDFKTVEQLSVVANNNNHDERPRGPPTADGGTPPSPNQQRSPLSISSAEVIDETKTTEDSRPRSDQSHTSSEVVRNHSETTSLPTVADPAATSTSTNSDPKVTATNVVEERTLAFKQKRFASGFRNAGMVFTWFVMYAAENNYTSILLNNLNWKDLYGISRPWGFAPHDFLFDVEHWNTHSPLLPRIVPYDPKVHDQYDPATLGPNWSATLGQDPTRPTFAGTYLQGFNQYRMYTRRVTNDPIRFPRSPVETAMMKGAFRPSAVLQAFMDQLTGGDPYLALHARVEPDMQNHPVCRDKKVVLLSDIVTHLEAFVPAPDFGRVFVATNRPMLETEVESNPNNTIAVDNLNELNRMRDHGMWNGTVTVFEAGSSLMRKSGGSFLQYSGIAGAVIDYFLALQAASFVGTEVSSFTADLIQSRFFRDNRRNYHYRPEGIVVATSETDVQPPRFAC